MSYLTFGLNYYIHGLDVFGYHLVNLAIHYLSALFLYLIIFNTLHLPLLARKYAAHAGSIALLATILWAISPIQVTAVTYIVQRMASMAGMFFIMAMFFYLKGRTGEGLLRKIVCFTLCIMSGLLAVASKENAAILPVVIFLYDLILIQGVNRETLKRNLLWAAVPLVILIGLAFVLANPLNMLSGYANREFTLMERLLTQPRILVYYVSLMLYPIMDRLTLVHEIELSRSLFTPWTTLPAILFWGGVVGLGTFLAKKQPLISFCLLFFVVTHLIESSIIPLELIYEHRNYIPSMMFFLLLAIGFVTLLEFLRQAGKNLALVFVAGLLCFMLFDQGHTVYARNQLFHHPLYLWEDNVKKAPGLSRVHNNLGQVYWDMGEYEKARISFMRAIETDRHHRHTLRAVPYTNMGNYYLHAGNDPLAAIEYFQKSLEIRPNHWPTLYKQAYALVYLDALQVADAYLRQCIADMPGISVFYLLHGFVLLHGNQPESAIIQASNALRMKSQNVSAYKVLGEANRQLGNLEVAKRSWLAYAAVYPRDLQTNLALLDLAWQTEDHALLGQTTVNLLALKGDHSWQELFSTLPKYKSERVWMGDPHDLLPLFREGVVMEAGDVSHYE
ncbi:tetratricopeptide repeat protein [Desulfonatronum parangueonense]